MDLLEILFEALELNPKEYTLWVKYIFESSCPLVKILNDHIEKFYLALKNMT